MRQGGEVLSNSTKEWLLLSPGSNWELRADLDHQLKLPQQMAVTSLQPDILLWSTIAKNSHHGWTDGAMGRRPGDCFWEERYTDLSDRCKDAGWHAFTYPVEVGCRGFSGTSTQWLLKSLCVRGTKLSRALEDLAEKGSFWLWLQRKDKKWGTEGS